MGACLFCVCGSSEKAPPKKPEKDVGCSIAGYECYYTDMTPTWEQEKVAPSTDEIVRTSSADQANPATWANKVRVLPDPNRIPTPAPTTPITLETLQGTWVNSMGAKIKVEGTVVSMNGVVLRKHPVNTDESGVVTSIGRMWQLNGWLPDEEIEFKESPSRENMEHARSVIWTKATEDRMKEWNAQMAGLGYKESSKDPLQRSIDGCCPGTSDAAAKVRRDDKDKDAAELAELNSIIQKHRRAGLRRVPPRMVIPDFSNRGHTGLSVEHVHYLAASFRDKGFIPRKGNEGHDIPVLVEESTTSDLGRKSVENWRSKLSDEPGFPPKEHYEKCFAGSGLYTSLGNGHFNQALNLFATECPSIYSQQKYQIGEDSNLRDAIEQGVSSIVLKSDISLKERMIVSKLLNSKREFKWSVYEDGSVDILDATEDRTYCKQFEAMSKVLDAVELNCLVRAELGVKDSKRMGQ